jgi:hypothetical protein
MNRRAIVCTHHKAGTVWMRRTFRDICAARGIAYFRMPGRYKTPATFETPIVLMDSNSRWSGPRWDEDFPGGHDDRRLHLIRDPRDVVISAAHYHCTTSETPFRAARAEFDGATYQQTIAGLGDDRARFVFEMDHYSKMTLRLMAKWDYQRPDCFELRYEDLIVDREGALFARAAAHLGFGPEEIDEVKALFVKNSIFPARPEHIRSGAVAQWRSAYDRETGEAFLERFGDILIKLGYERDDSWAGALPVTR